MTTGGPCVACSTANGWWLAFAAVVCVFFLGCVYGAIVSGNVAKEATAAVLVAIVGSQILTVLQMMGVLEILTVEWPEPFAAVLQIASLLNFRVEVLNMGCVLPVSSLTRYVATAFGFSLLLLVMFAFHLLRLLFFHWEKCKSARCHDFTPSLIGAVGTIFMTVFIAVTSAIFSPFQCEGHPNGEYTMQTYL